MEKNNSNREAVLCCVGDEAESRIGSCVRWSKSEKSRTLCCSLGGRRESLEKIVPVDSKEMQNRAIMAVRKNDDVKNRTQKKQNQSREKLQRVLCREELWNSSVCYCNAVLYLVLFCTLVSLVLYLVFQCIVVQLCGWQCGCVAVWQCGWQWQCGSVAVWQCGWQWLGKKR